MLLSSEAHQIQPPLQHSTPPPVIMIMQVQNQGNQATNDTTCFGLKPNASRA